MVQTILLVITKKNNCLASAQIFFKCAWSIYKLPTICIIIIQREKNDCHWTVVLDGTRCSLRRFKFTIHNIIQISRSFFPIIHRPPCGGPFIICIITSLFLWTSTTPKLDRVDDILPAVHFFFHPRLYIICRYIRQVGLLSIKQCGW